MTRDMRGKGIFDRITGLAGLTRKLNRGSDRKCSVLSAQFFCDGLCGALGADAVDRDIGAADAGSGGELPKLGRIECGLLRVGVADFSAGVAVEMDMLVKVGAVAGLRPLDMHLLDQAAGGQVLQAIVNRSQRDARRPVLHAMENVVGRRVVVRLGEDLKNLPAMRREADISPQDGQTAVQTGRLLRWT